MKRVIFIITTTIIASCILSGCQWPDSGTPEYTMPESTSQTVGNANPPDYETSTIDYTGLSEGFIKDQLGRTDFDDEKQRINANFKVIEAGMAETEAEFELWKGIMADTSLSLSSSDSQYKIFMELCQALIDWANSEKISMDKLFENCSMSEEEVAEYLNKASGISKDLALTLPGFVEVDGQIKLAENSIPTALIEALYNEGGTNAITTEEYNEAVKNN